MSASFKTRTFNRWMRKSGLSGQALDEAVTEMESGLIDADLGGHVVKKRVALPGRGKRGSARTLVDTGYKNRWFFVFGFNKNECDNIGPNALAALQETASVLLALRDEQIDTAITAGELLEIHHDEKT